uniref:Glycine N-acyltransferase-like protein n=1 Tax=Salarias fasciatus TaxID=181472 RepID=A0A672JJ16_SALFA
MKVLNREELQVAEGVLLQHLPKSYKMYGFLYGINRNKPTTLEVVVDTWPDFKVIICRPDPKFAVEFIKTVTCFSTDEQALRKVLTEENAIDWSTYLVIGGEKLESIVSPLLLYSELESRISSLKPSHVSLVNQTWKFGGNQQSYNFIRHLISNFPSCCIMDEHGQPVSWILVYDYGAMGILYTLPEHRGKGYAKVLISTMAKKLLAESHPVYCFIEEENSLSYKLFKNLGFIEDPSYRVVWLELNF